MGGDVLEPDEVSGRVADDRVDVGCGEQLFGADEVGHPARAGRGRPPPEPLDGAQPRRRARFDKHDETQAPDGQRPDLVRFHRSAYEAARFWRDGKSGCLDPGDAASAVPSPFPQGVAAFEEIVLDRGSMGMAPRIGGGCIVADQADDLLATCPGRLGGLPLLEEGVLGRHLPFEAARMTPQRDARQRRVGEDVGQNMKSSCS